MEDLAALAAIGSGDEELLTLEQLDRELGLAAAGLLRVAREPREAN